MSKHVLIVLLAGANLCLAACLLLTTYTPPEAVAQAIRPDGTYILVAAEAQEGNDVIYLVDLGRKQLHAFGAEMPVVTGRPLMVRWYHTRDLARDFRRIERGAK